MRNTPCLLALCVLQTACIKTSGNISTLSQSGNLRMARLKNMRAIVNGEEARAVLQQTEASKKLAQNLVRSQFRFLTGAIGATRGHGVHFNAPPRIVNVTAHPQGALIEYDLDFDINIPSQNNSSTSFEAFFPAHVGSKDLISFYEKFGPACGRTDAHNTSTPENALQFFYFFNPARAGCSVRQSAANQDPLVFRSTVLIDAATVKGPSRKAPPYDAMWRDGVLKAAILVAPTGTEDEEPELPGTLPKSDSGIASFNMMFWKLKKRFPQANISVLGKPSMLGPKEAPGEKNWHVRFEAVSDGDKFDIHVMLAPKVYLEDIAPNNPMWTAYNNATKGADFVAFAGHAGFGKSLDTLNRHGGFEPGQSFLFYINSCWSVGYFFSDNSAQAGENLLLRIEALNKGEPWAKNIDFILNETSSNMYKNAHNVLTIIDALQYADRTYEEILSKLSQDAQPVVFGEEDNPDLLP
jgi:hypothetical protein